MSCKINKHNLLTCGYYEGETIGALKKCWTGYKIAKREGDRSNLIKYASRIQKLQKQLGVMVSDFPNLGMSRRGEKEDYAKYLEEYEG